jgi:hypothetical protein
MDQVLPLTQHPLQVREASKPVYRTTGRQPWGCDLTRHHLGSLQQVKRWYTGSTQQHGRGSSYCRLVYLVLCTWQAGH